MQRHLIDYIRRPETVTDAQSLSHLDHLVKEYPYFHAARILHLQALYRQHSPRFDEELRVGAALVPEREAIFRLTEEQNYSKMEEKRKFDSSDYEESRTSSLIDSFLQQQPQPAPNTSVRHRVDATQDYFGYLYQNEELDLPAEVEMNGGGVVEEFLNKEQGRIVLKETDSQPESEPEIEQKEEKSEILTEVMAGIYIKQGNFEKAIKIIRQLSLKYPKKNRYFADQIRFLEKIIINNKHK